MKNPHLQVTYECKKVWERHSHASQPTTPLLAGLVLIGSHL